jgi:hypothetical protein
MHKPLGDLHPLHGISGNMIPNKEIAHELFSKVSRGGRNANLPAECFGPKLDRSRA